MSQEVEHEEKDVEQEANEEKDIEQEEHEEKGIEQEEQPEEEEEQGLKAASAPANAHANAPANAPARSRRKKGKGARARMRREQALAQLDKPQACLHVHSANKAQVTEEGVTEEGVTETTETQAQRQELPLELPLKLPLERGDIVVTKVSRMFPQPRTLEVQCLIWSSVKGDYAVHFRSNPHKAWLRNLGRTYTKKM